MASQLLYGGIVTLANASYDLDEALVLDLMALKRPLTIQGGFARLRPTATFQGALIRVTGASRDNPVTLENLVIDCGNTADVGLRVESCAGARTLFQGVRVLNPRACAFEVESTGNISFEDCVSIQELSPDWQSDGWRLIRPLGTRLLRCTASGFTGTGIHINTTAGVGRCSVVDARVTDNGGAGITVSSESTEPLVSAEFTVRGGYFARNGAGAIRVERIVAGGHVTGARFLNGANYGGAAVVVPPGSMTVAGNSVFVVGEPDDEWATYAFGSPSTFRPDLVVGL
ncbi:MAG: right-handed parallel beta-helix repeat-containing protein [Myxococcales bacterium]|nr:right-handed parallel beta-helix repeat-containing protein [Myxococcales bacterium]